MSDTITSLIEKLEGVEGPSIALDAEICWTLERDRATSAFWRGAMGLPRPLPDEFSRLPRGLGMASMEAGSPNYTASLDAALAMAERVGVRPYQADASIKGKWSWMVVTESRLGNLEANPYARATAATPALALCAAILRAQSEAR